MTRETIVDLEERVRTLEASLRIAQQGERLQRQRVEALQGASREMWRRTLDATTWRRERK
jgi:exonuclease VII small subunit